MSFIGIRETAFFSLDLQKEANEYARKKKKAKDGKLLKPIRVQDTR